MASAIFCSMRVTLHDRRNDPSQTTCVTSAQDDSSETYLVFCTYLRALSQGCFFEKIQNCLSHISIVWLDLLSFCLPQARRNSFILFLQTAFFFLQIFQKFGD